MRRILLALAVLVAGQLPALGQSSGLTQLRTGDDTRGLEAVGRLDIGPRGFCTATLIAEDLVLTAAHCLFDATTRERVPLSDFEFLAGLRDGRASAYRDVRRAIIHPDYVYQGPEGDEVRVINDLALLELNQPIRTGGIAPLRAAAQPRKGQPVGVVSYAIDRDARPSLERACDVLARPRGMLIISCTVDFGASGAPVIVFTEGEPRIVSVVSAKAEAMGRPVSLGTDLVEPLDTLLRLARTEAPALPQVTPVVRRGSAGSGGGGAKFVRP